MDDACSVPISPFFRLALCTTRRRVNASAVPRDPFTADEHQGAWALETIHRFHRLGGSASICIANPESRRSCDEFQGLSFRARNPRQTLLLTRAWGFLGRRGSLGMTLLYFG